MDNGKVLSPMMQYFNKRFHDVIGSKCIELIAQVVFNMLKNKFGMFYCLLQKLKNLFIQELNSSSLLTLRLKRLSIKQ